MHIGLDAEAGEIVAAELTTNDADDASHLGPLLDLVVGPVASFTGGAHDHDSVDRTVANRQPEATVIVPPGWTTAPGGTATTEPTERDRHLQCIGFSGTLGSERPNIVLDDTGDISFDSMLRNDRRMSGSPISWSRSGAAVTS